MLQRGQLHIQVLDALEHLIQQSLQRADFAQVQYYARRQLAFEPWREGAHRHLIAALARSSDRTAALDQYESCRRLLAEEMGAEPDAQTEALVAEIRKGDLRFTIYAITGRNLPFLLHRSKEKIRHCLSTNPSSIQNQKA